ncbi:HTH-type transcriptional activator RhaS [Gulosibacter molinativorax]|nr:HTH-type transcriptional activator RhaS [Gulosibacter molinativorax]
MFPSELPVNFTRLLAGSTAKDLVAWWWTTTWAISPGQHSAQEILAFPASNLAFQDDEVRFWGPSTRRSTQVLVGQGWVLGALLRPAAVPAFTKQPASCRDDSFPVATPDLHGIVRASASNLAGVVDEVETWLADHVGPITDEAYQANQLAELAITDSTIGTVSDLAGAIGVSTRTVNRLATKYVGLSPYNMIRRRRLQEAVEWTRENPADSLAEIAVPLIKHTSVTKHAPCSV